MHLSTPAHVWRRQRQVARRQHEILGSFPAGEGRLLRIALHRLNKEKEPSESQFIGAFLNFNHFNCLGCMQSAVGQC